jgi:hypothetical protein
MKKIILIVFTLIGVGYYASGQPGLIKGSFLVGGNLNLSFESDKEKYGSETTDGPKYNTIVFYPKAGYFLADNFAAGLGIGYYSSGYKYEDDYGTDKSTSSMFLAGLFGRYYVRPLTHAAFFGELNIGFGTGKNKDEYDESGRSVAEVTETKQSMFAINIKPGATIFITEKLGIDFTYGSLGYETYTEKDEESEETYKQTTGTFTLSFNPGTITFGVFFYFD